MSAFIVDASATLPWCLEDEATPWTEALLDGLRGKDNAVVPAHWPNEVSNALLTACRRSRIASLRAQTFWDELALLPITVEPPITPDRAKFILSLCEQYRLTFYDSTYLELALRLELPMATLDNDLRRAGVSAGIALIL